MAKVTSWDKLKLLLWKNWILLWKQKSQLAQDLLIPLIWPIVLIFIRKNMLPESKNETNYPPLDITNLKLFNKKIEKNQSSKKFPQFKLLYSPNTSAVFDNIMQSATKTLSISEYEGYANAEDLEGALTSGNYLAGVEFNNIKEYPKKLSYALRFPSELRTSTNIEHNWLTMKLFDAFEMTGPRNAKDDDGGIPVGYLREGFIPIQHAISMAYLKLASNQTSLPEVEMQRYPYPAHIVDPMFQMLDVLFPMLMFLYVYYPCINLTKNIALEKEKQLKEIMKIMGLPNWIHWTAWFVKSFIMLGISAILITILLKIKWSNDVSVLTYSSSTAFFFFLLITVITSICFAFMLATFFRKATTASMVSQLIALITFVPFLVISSTNYELSAAQKLVWSLLSNTAMGFGFQVIVGFEATGEGLQWSNLFSPVSVDDNLTLGGIILVMLATCVLYMLICLYIEQIFPGEYGIARKWYFPFTAKFWCGDSKYKHVKETRHREIQRRNPEAFEAEPTGKHVGIQVKNLKKKFGRKMAVKGLSVNMYEDEITVLLGHNGAGKTTTISMLTGMYPPTAGTAIINGSDIRTNIEGARMSMGICPQHNVLFDDLSVSNHIVFFSRLKGVKGEAIQKEVDKYLKRIELENKANVASSKLSGGMKRKLSLCCALCGDTKVVFCDEPSSGMDPAARRQLWDLLRAEKVGRTVLLTTHFMDEADVLGDRIAIMCDGELKCHGTSFFLKKKYGSGYHLICVKSDDCNSDEVTALLGDYIPGIKPESDIGAELSYNLPDMYSSVFEEMLRALEENTERLNLNGYGIGLTSMEEVFMKVGAENANDGTRKGKNARMNGNSGFPDEDFESIQSHRTFSENSRLLKGTGLFLNQWHAMLLKKFLHTFRHKLFFIIQNMIPIFFVVFAILPSIIQGTFKELPSITISPTQYPTVVTILEKDASLNNLDTKTVEVQIADYYKTIANAGPDYTFQSTGSSSFTDYIIDLGKTMQVRINSCYLAAATVAKGKITAWFNNQPLHTAPLTINLVHNAMAKALIHPDAEISITNAPLPYTTDTVLKQLNEVDNIGAQLAPNLCICMGFVIAFYILFLIKERVSRSKLLQFVGGVKVWTFWLTHFLWDMVTYIITALIAIIVIACFQQTGYSQFSELGRYFLILVLFGFSILQFTYLISFFFVEPTTGFAVLLMINMYSGMIPYVFISPNFFSKDYVDILLWVFRVFPTFCLIMSLNKLHINTATRKACNNPDIVVLPDALRCQVVPECCSSTPFFDWTEPGVLPEVICMVITAVVFFLILIMLEYGLINELIYKIRQLESIPPASLDDGFVDDDVHNEKERILAMSRDELAGQNLVLDRLTKYYDTFLAVNKISLCVKQTECFGLLGVNGAGKTTIFKIMTGDERSSSGSAYIKGMSLDKNMNKIYNEIGYCPQFDALFDDLTGRETLKIFCLLRGIHKNRVAQVSEELANSFGFMKHMDKKTKTYSGGNKRKLSTALAVIGSPTVIFLDEPTSGLDPAARRQLWNMVCRIRDSGKSIVLTSHSMEECEALCTRLAIMVSGEFKCIGSTQHLKNKFSKGLILKMKVNRTSVLMRQMSRTSNNYNNDEKSIPLEVAEQDIRNAKQFVEREFSQAILQEEYEGILTFYIPLETIKWSQIFGLMEKNRKNLNIEDYSISQTTLEEIFLDFAKLQREDPRANNEKTGCCTYLWKLITCRN